LKRKESGLPPPPAAAYASTVDEKKANPPVLEHTQSEAELQEALRLSQSDAKRRFEQDEEERLKEEAELQRAIRESQAVDKGKGRAVPQRKSTLDDPEVQMALAMSASASDAHYPVNEDEYDEESQRRELERFNLSRASMFDTSMSLLHHASCEMLTAVCKMMLLRFLSFRSGQKPIRQLLKTTMIHRQMVHQIAGLGTLL